MRKLYLLGLAPLLLLGSLVALSPAPVEAAQAKKVIAVKDLPRGAKPTPKAIRDSLPKHVIRAATPTSYLMVPKQLSMWGNGPDPAWPGNPNGNGNCVSAEESAARACKGIFISDQSLYNWCVANGTLDGANLPPVMQQMATSGFSQDNNTYNDGPYTSVDYNDWATLTNAIYQGPVKLGLASGQFNNVAGVGSQNGWIMTGFQQDGNEDHCTGAWGFGTMTQLCNYLGVTPPADAANYPQCIGMFTWSTEGIIDYQSFKNIVGEAYLRTPTNITIGMGVPTPDSVTIYGGTPTPPPTTFTLTTTPSSGTVPLTVTLTSVLTPTGTVSLNWGDGSPVVPSATFPLTYTYQTAGSYTITATGSTVATATVTVSNVTPPPPPQPCTPTFHVFGRPHWRCDSDAFVGLLGRRHH
jgi:hypothetical protein